MIINLFSIFEPSSSLFFINNWFSLIIFIFLIPTNFWKINSRLNYFYLFFNLFITNELKNNIYKNKFPSLVIFLRIFWFIFINNFLGLFPYIFTATSHLLITLTIAIPFWLIFLIYGWLNLYNHIFSHLVPLGTPLPLSRFIVIIETIRNLIRPITLSVRLAANIIAGHLLLSLLSNIRENNPQIFLPSFFIIIILLILEYSVAVIQSYVFITLISLYLNEIN